MGSRGFDSDVRWQSVANEGTHVARHTSSFYKCLMTFVKAQGQAACTLNENIFFFGGTVCLQENSTVPLFDFHVRQCDVCEKDSAVPVVGFLSQICGRLP